MQEVVVEPDSRDESPHLVFLSDVIGELGLEGMKSADPTFLVALLVSHDGGVDHFGQNEHSNAHEDEYESDWSDLEVWKEGLQAL